MRNSLALAALLALSAPAWAAHREDAADYLSRIAEIDDAGPELNAVIVTNPTRLPRPARPLAALSRAAQCW